MHYQQTVSIKSKQTHLHSIEYTTESKSPSFSGILGQMSCKRRSRSTSHQTDNPNAEIKMAGHKCSKDSLNNKLLGSTQGRLVYYCAGHVINSREAMTSHHVIAA